MFKFQKLYHILVLLFPAVLISCATPIMPSGGPADKTGPVLEYTVPETGTTNFSGRTFEFHFDEFVNRNSVNRAITIEPDIGIGFDISWKRKTMILTFDRALPENTTILIKVGADLSDTQNNKISQPITLAISTGNEIDRGSISGRILDARNGRGAAEKKIFLYREPIEIEGRANYLAETDTAGRFNFSYLSEGTYQILLVEDANRNKIWDREREAAYPFFRERLTIEKGGIDSLDVIYTMTSDTLSPQILAVGLLSTNRMRLRFSESIEINESTVLEVRDSLDNMYSKPFPLYISQADPFVLYAFSEQDLEDSQNYSLKVNSVFDISGNLIDERNSEVSFIGSEQQDTTAQRIITANGKTGLYTDESFVVTFASPIRDQVIRDSSVVIEGDVDFDDWPEIEFQRNKLIISPQGNWIEGIDYRFLVWNPKTERRVLFEPDIWSPNDLGDIEVNVVNSDSADSNNYILRVLKQDGKEIYSTTFSDQVSVEGLPPLSYTLILFRDDNKNGKWDRGSVIPFESPEPYYVQRNVEVRRGFTSEFEISFNQ